MESRGHEMVNVGSLQEALNRTCRMQQWSSILSLMTRRRNPSCREEAHNLLWSGTLTGDIHISESANDQDWGHYGSPRLKFYS